MANTMDVGEASRSEGSGCGCRACRERGRYAEVRGQGGAVCVEAFAQPGQRRRVGAEQLLQRRDERGPFTGFRHLRACVRCGSTRSFLFVCSPAHLFGRVVVGGEWWVDERVAPRMAQVLSDRTAEWLRCWLVGGMVAMVVDVMITTVIDGVIASLVDWLAGWRGSRTAVWLQPARRSHTALCQSRSSSTCTYASVLAPLTCPRTRTAPSSMTRRGGDTRASGRCEGRGRAAGEEARRDAKGSADGEGRGRGEDGEGSAMCRTKNGSVRALECENVRV